MISERLIAEKFSAVWKEHLPFLTTNFIRVLNEGHVYTVNQSEVAFSENANIRYDLISEFAFNASEIIFNENKSFETITADNQYIYSLLKDTAKSINREFPELELSLSETEKNEAKLIAFNIIEFINRIKKNSCQFKPRLIGYGIIPEIKADLLIDDTLFEIKTVNRNFRSTDLKQLLIYIALQHMSSDAKWQYAGLYNPRRGIYCRFYIKRLIYDLSGGRSLHDVFEGLLNGLTRDIFVDSKF